MTQDFRCQ